MYIHKTFLFVGVLATIGKFFNLPELLFFYFQLLAAEPLLCVCVSVGEGVHGLTRVVQLLAAEPLLCVCVSVGEGVHGLTRVVQLLAAEPLLCVCVSVGEGVHGLTRVVQLLAAEPLLCVCECRRGSTRTHSRGATTRC